ncbi:MAG: hypothetical protein U9R34_08465 [Nanoarchaeota archaeon]|nr:hypothetical protein [Nanoarchaeota archaeon]
MSKIRGISVIMSNKMRKRNMKDKTGKAIKEHKNEGRLKVWIR